LPNQRRKKPWLSEMTKTGTMSRKAAANPTSTARKTIHRSPSLKTSMTALTRRSTMASPPSCPRAANEAPEKATAKANGGRGVSDLAHKISLCRGRGVHRVQGGCIEGFRGWQNPAAHLARCRLEASARQLQLQS